jgi:hypothetical protein
VENSIEVDTPTAGGFASARQTCSAIYRGIRATEFTNFSDKKYLAGYFDYYRWRKEYGGLKLEQARRLKELEKENSRLRRLVNDLSLEKQVLKEVAEGNF